MELNNDLSIIDLNKDVIIFIISKMHPNDIYSLILSNKRFAKIMSSNIQYVQSMFLTNINTSVGGYKLIYKQFTHSGKKHGLYESWYENGQRFEFANYNNGSLDGLYELWTLNGDIINIINIKNGLYNGLYEGWRYSNTYKKAYLYCKKYFINNVLDGISTCYYENGSIQNRYNFVNGIKVGLCEEWYRNNKLKVRHDFDNGLCEEFYQNGNKKKLVNYKNKCKNGLCITWYKNNMIKGIKNYKNGYLHGIQESWLKDGIKVLTVYENNKVKK